MNNNSNCIGKCNDCIYFERREAIATETENVYCTKEKTLRLIEFRIPKGQDVKLPFWCPIEEARKIQLKLDNGEKLTDGEKKTLLMARKPFISWEEIEVNHIYHIPPLLGGKRKDVLVTWKGEYSCTFRNLSNEKNTVETIYPSTLESRFFVKHKLKKIEKK